MIERDQLAALRGENARLIALLEDHGIEWRLPPAPTPPESAQPVPEPEPPRLSTAEKVALFRRLFRGRTDVYPVRWESKTTGRTGYTPACGNEWRAGVCEKPRIKCGECNNRLLIPLTDGVIYEHLTGNHTIGVYHPAGDRQRAPARCYVHRRGRSKGAVETIRICQQKAGRSNAKIAHCDAGQHDLF